MVSRQKRLIKQHVKGQIQQSKALDQIKKTQIMVANLKAERVPQLTVANTVDVIRAADLPCIAGMSENLNYFDMSSSFKCLIKMYTACKSESSPMDSNLCTSVADSEKTSLHCNVLPHISNSTSNIAFPSFPHVQVMVFPQVLLCSLLLRKLWNMPQHILKETRALIMQKILYLHMTLSGTI